MLNGRVAVKATFKTGTVSNSLCLKYTAYKAQIQAHFAAKSKVLHIIQYPTAVFVHFP